MTSIYEFLDRKFPPDEGTYSIEEVRTFLDGLLEDHVVDAVSHSFLSSDGEEIELLFHVSLRLKNGSPAWVECCGWYSASNPQEGVELIDNYRIDSYRIAQAWLDKID